MIRPQVNRIRDVALLSLALACTPASSKRQSPESTAVTRADTASVAAARAPTDSNITRADLARIQGSATAPLWVIEVSDFQCPYCKQWHDQTYPMLRDQYVKTGKIRLAYVNFPLAIHPHGSRNESVRHHRRLEQKAVGFAFRPKEKKPRDFSRGFFFQSCIYGVGALPLKPQVKVVG